MWRTLKLVSSFSTSCRWYSISNDWKDIFLEEEELSRWDPTKLENETFDNLGVRFGVCCYLASLGIVKPNTIQLITLLWPVQKAMLHHTISSLVAKDSGISHFSPLQGMRPGLSTLIVTPMCELAIKIYHWT